MVSTINPAGSGNTSKRPYFKREKKQQLCQELAAVQDCLSNLKVPKKLVAEGFLGDVQLFKERADEAGRLANIAPNINWPGRKLQARLAEVRELKGYFDSLQ